MRFSPLFRHADAARRRSIYHALHHACRRPSSPSRLLPSRYVARHAAARYAMPYAYAALI